MPFPEGFLQELKLRNPLEDVVSQYVTLKRAGSNRVGCCPFHSEKTPSFTVYTQQEPHFYCYGCQAGGDVVTFVMRIENLDYRGAIEYLANRAGLPMPQTSHFEKTVDKKRFYEMNAKAAKFWYQNLMSPEGKPGLDYLTGRGLSLAVIRRFGLGYASNSYDALTSYLLKEGYRPQEIKEAFLGGFSQKSGRMFDYFRGRAIFPIIDIAGNVVAFSGRFVGEAGENDRKYFNTNDTPVFKKSRTVFALNFAKNSPEKSLILCEGNMDAVSLQAAGVTNAVASLGTALTADQCRLLARFADTVYICYDSDEAGRRATKKAIRLLSETGVKVKVVSLSGKTSDGKEIKDPDDFIRAFGKGAFQKRVQSAKGAIEYLFSEIQSRYSMDDMDEKNAFIKEGIAMLSEVDSPVEKELFLARMQDLTGVNVDVLKAQTERKTQKNLQKAEKEQLQTEIRKLQGFGNRVNPDKAKFSSRATKEEGILGILLLRSDYLLDPKIRPILNPELFSCAFYKSVLEKLLSCTENGEELEPAALNEFFSPEEMGELQGLRQKRAELGSNTPAILRELFERLEEEIKKKAEKDVPLSAEWLEKLKAEKTRKE